MDDMIPMSCLLSLAPGLPSRDKSPSLNKIFTKPDATVRFGCEGNNAADNPAGWEWRLMQRC